MTSPVSVFNTLIAERITLRAQTSQRAQVPPPAAFVSSAKPPSAIGSRAGVAYTTYSPAFRDTLYPAAYQADGQPTLIRDWVYSASSSNINLNNLGDVKTFSAQLGGPSPDVGSAPVNKGVLNVGLTNGGAIGSNDYAYAQGNGSDNSNLINGY